MAKYGIYGIYGFDHPFRLFLINWCSVLPVPWIRTGLSAVNEFENSSHTWMKIRTILGTDESPRLEPEAEWNNGNGWSKVDTEAEEVSHVFN